MTTINSASLTVSEPFNLSAAAKHTKGSPLLYLHPQQIQHIFSFLNEKDSGSLACTCKQTNLVSKSIQPVKQSSTDSPLPSPAGSPPAADSIPETEAESSEEDHKLSPLIKFPMK